MLLKEKNELEEHRLLAEYWQSNYTLLETAVKVAYQRLVASVGEKRAEKIFKEVKPKPKGDLMIPNHLKR